MSSENSCEFKSIEMAPFITPSSPFIGTAAQAALLLATVAGAGASAPHGSAGAAVASSATHQQRPEVVAFYGQDAQPTCTPSYWLEFPPETVTTIIMQDSRILNTGGSVNKIQ